MDIGKLFCVRCGEQLNSIDEISQGVCHRCESIMPPLTKQGDFYCWTCGKKLGSMSEIAQGVCTACKHKIIKTLYNP